MKSLKEIITERLHITKDTNVEEFYCKNNPKLAEKYKKLFESNPDKYNVLNFLIDLIKTSDNITEDWFNEFYGIYIIDSKEICATNRSPYNSPTKIKFREAITKYNELNNTHYYVSYAGKVNENIALNAKLIRNVIDVYKEKFPNNKVDNNELVEINNDKVKI